MLPPYFPENRYAVAQAPGEPEVVLSADLGRVFDLLGCAAEHCAERADGHRTRHADPALAADLGT